MRSNEEVKRLIEIYPVEWRRWCYAIENGGCACVGCVRHPSPTTVRGDPEYVRFPNPTDQLTKDEVEHYILINKENK